MEYLSLYEINSSKDDIRRELELLLSNKAIVTKPKSIQWQFFNECVNKLFNHSSSINKSNSKSGFNSLSSTHKAQLKFEVEDKLKKFYLKPGRKINFVFQMIHKKELQKIFFDEEGPYPDVGGYSILIRDTSNELTPNYNLTEKDIKEYIERVVVEAVETEFDAYHSLPEIIGDELLNAWFCKNGPAKKEIMHVLTHHKERGWILTNPMNPSTKRILMLKVKKIEKREIFVSTTEYWYLRWWDTKKKSYAFPYRETNRQQYVLRKDNGIWKVYETIRPAPRTSIPNRRKYSLCMQ
jgi:hypothetical protein